MVPQKRGPKQRDNYGDRVGNFPLHCEQKPTPETAQLGRDAIELRAKHDNSRSTVEVAD